MPVALHICVIVLVAVTAVSFAVPFPAGIHAALVLLTALVAPGAGATVSLPFRALAESIGMWIGVSLSIDVVLGLAMVWIPWWHPGAAAALAGAVSLVPLVVAWAVRWAR